MYHLSQIITNRKNKIVILRVSLGIIFLFFGILKFVPHASPAEALAQETIYNLAKGLISKHTGLILLAIIETSLGIMFIMGRFLKIAIIIGLLHMFFTFFPLFLSSNSTYTNQPVIFTMVGQYIMKNIVFISALWLLWPIDDDKNEPTKFDGSKAQKELHKQIEV